jgi:Flp pilus assembly protein TadD
VSLERNIDTPEKIQSAISTARELDRGKTSKASEQLIEDTKAIPELKRSAADYLVLATDHWRVGHVIEGITYAQQGLRLEPKDIRLEAALLHCMGGLLMDKGEKDEAERHYRDAIDTDPAFSSSHCNLGILLADLNRDDEAEAAYRKAIELDPDYADAH